MARKKEIDVGPIVDGVVTVTLSSWKHFSKFIARDMHKYPSYIYRGQTRFSWKLESSYDRLCRARKVKGLDLESHLTAFKFASRGRRGHNPPVLDSENDWWALGQHFGLATPLLDWSRSPFVGLYFSFMDEEDKGEYRVVYAVQFYTLQEKSYEIIRENRENEEDKPVVSVFLPTGDENIRLVNQSGLFLRMPVGVDLEGWIKSNFKGYKKAALIKIKIPNKDVQECLIHLNRMNVNHSTLFPDLYGCAQFVNTMIGNGNYDNLPYMGVLGKE